MMRKGWIGLLAAALLLAALPLPRTAEAEEDPGVSARCAVLMGPEGEILWEKNARERSLIASTTKLMTALVTVRHSRMEDRVTVPAACCGIEGSSMYLAPGEEYSVEQLLTGLLLASGNDAAETLALHCAGSEEGFVAWMNEEAARLGLKDSHFMNPHGLDEEGHYSTAADLGQLMAACMGQPELAKILGRTDALIHDNSYVNHNKLLRRCPGCLGGKTGYTQAAGRCLVSCCEREGTRLYCVTLADPEDWADQMALYDWGFARYVTRSVTENLRYMLPVYGGEKAAISLRAEELPLFLPKDAALELRLELPRFALAPIRAGSTLGLVTLLRDGEELGRAPLVAAESVGQIWSET